MKELRRKKRKSTNFSTHQRTDIVRKKSTLKSEEISKFRESQPRSKIVLAEVGDAGGMTWKKAPKW